MKVLLIPEISITGGTGTFIKHLMEIHKNLHIVTHVFLPHNLLESPFKAFFEDKGASIIAIPDRKPFELISYLSLIYEIKNYRSYIKKFKPDLIVCSTGTLGFNFFTFFCSYPLVFILHSYPKKVLWWEKPVFLIPKLFSNSSKIIYTVSKYSKRMIVDHWGVKEKNIHVIYNSTSSKNSLKYRPQKRIILTVGHVVEYKNPFVWIEIAKQITQQYADTEFVWLGNGHLLEECIAQTSGYPQIRFMGFEPEPSKYYSKAHIYLHPSRIESLGLSVIDALAYGVPSVISNAGGLPETVDDGFSGFICTVDDTSTYCEKIKLLLHNRALYEEMAQNAYFCAKERFNPDNQRNKICALYKSTIANYKASN